MQYKWGYLPKRLVRWWDWWVEPHCNCVRGNYWFGIRGWVRIVILVRKGKEREGGDMRLGGHGEEWGGNVNEISCGWEEIDRWQICAQAPYARYRLLAYSWYWKGKIMLLFKRCMHPRFRVSAPNFARRKKLTSVIAMIQTFQVNTFKPLRKCLLSHDPVIWHCGPWLATIVEMEGLRRRGASWVIGYCDCTLFPFFHLICWSCDMR